jgi:hypothetical protein
MGFARNTLKRCFEYWIPSRMAQGPNWTGTKNLREIDAGLIFASVAGAIEMYTDRETVDDKVIA